MLAWFEFVSRLNTTNALASVNPGATDIGRDDANVVLLEPEMLGEHGADHVRHLARGVDDEPSRRRLERRDQR